MTNKTFPQQVQIPTAIPSGKSKSLRACVSRLLMAPGRWFFAFLVAASCSLTLQAQVDGINMDQISYAAVHSGTVPCSEYGHVSLAPHQSPGVPQFLQVVGTLGPTPGWVVRNLPIVESIKQTSITVDLTQLGVSRGSCINGSVFVYKFQLTDMPIGSAPEFTPMRTLLVGSRIDRAEGDIPVPPVFPGSLAISLPPPAFTFAPGPWEFIDRPGMGNVVQGKNECGPGAVANSMHWLQSNGDINLGGDTPDQSLAKLKSDMQPDGWTARGVNQRETVEGKLRFAQRPEHPLNLQIHYQADSTLTNLGASVTVGSMTANRDGNGGPPTLDYLLQELRRGQDVELSLDWLDSDGKKTGGHVIVVSGALESGNFNGIWFNDDALQDGTGNGLRTDHWGDLEMEGNYLRIGGLHRNRVKAIYSESPIVQLNYTLIDLGTGTGTASAATGINSLGQVSGINLQLDNTTQAFIWDPTFGQQSLPGLAPGATAAFALNANGKEVGVSVVDQTNRPVIWVNGQPSDLGGSPAIAYGIDDYQEWIAGAAQFGSATHAVVWAGDQPIDLGTLGGINSVAVSINGFGQVAGSSQTASGLDHPFLWSPAAGMIDLGALPTLSQCDSQNLNNLGQIVGVCYNDINTDPAAFVFHYGTLELLPNTLGGQHSAANSINRLGWTVGAADDSMGLYHPVLWQGFTRLIDLTNVGNSSGCILTNVTAISDRGDIAGTASCMGASHAVLLTRQQGNRPSALH